MNCKNLIGKNCRTVIIGKLIDHKTGLLSNELIHQYVKQNQLLHQKRNTQL